MVWITWIGWLDHLDCVIITWIRCDRYTKHQYLNTHLDRRKIWIGWYEWNVTAEIKQHDTCVMITWIRISRWWWGHLPDTPGHCDDHLRGWFRWNVTGRLDNDDDDQDWWCDTVDWLLMQDTDEWLHVGDARPDVIQKRLTDHNHRPRTTANAVIHCLEQPHVSWSWALDPMKVSARVCCPCMQRVRWLLIKYSVNNYRSEKLVDWRRAPEWHCEKWTLLCFI